MHDLILIGLPASGKTSVGRAWPGGWICPFTTATRPWRQRRGSLYLPYFPSTARRFFRDMESKILEDLCSRERCVIATGGGAVLRQENRLLLRRSGVVFWLDRPLEDIMSTDFQTGRPLLAEGRQALERLAAARRGLYASCACHRIPESLLEKAVEDIENIWRGENI